MQSLAVVCVANILPYLPLDKVEDVLLPFALESASDAVHEGSTVRIFGGGGDAHTEVQGVPKYLVETDFFLSEGEPVIALCCGFRFCHATQTGRA